MRFRVPAL